jgi:hypothetical protein
MDFDIYGKAPRSNAGRYFRANWVEWHQIARLCLRVAPDICSQFDEKYWFSNDGLGLDDAGPIALADALDLAIETDALLKYEDELSGHETEEDLRVRNFFSMMAARLAKRFKSLKDLGSSIACANSPPFRGTAAVLRSGSRQA